MLRSLAATAVRLDFLSLSPLIMASMAKDYTKISAIQQFDSTACWAASLEWWARAIGNRPVIAQLDLIKMYRMHWDARNPNTNPNYGKISDEGLVEVLRDQRWGMNGANMPGSWFSCYDANHRMRFGPALSGLLRAFSIQLSCDCNLWRLCDSCRVHGSPWRSLHGASHRILHPIPIGSSSAGPPAEDRYP